MNKFFIKKPKKNYKIKLTKYENLTLKQYKNSAKVRGLTFNITENQFRHLIYSNCFYCNSEPVEYSNKFVRNGIDRYDSNIGYEYDNVISCCKVCNKMKSNLSTKEFINKVNAIKNNTDKIELLLKKEGKNSFVFLSKMLKFGRYLSPNELIECLVRGFIKKKDIPYSFKDSLSDFPKEYLMDLSVYKKNGIKTKGLTFEKYKRQQMKIWNSMED